MIPGEEHLPMSILEHMSDAPLEPHAYLAYATEIVRGRMEYWKTLAPNGRWWDSDGPPDAHIANVVANLDMALFHLEELKHQFDHWPRAVPALPALTKAT